MLGEINHIEIYVDNLEKTSGFWGWFLGELKYKPFQKWDKGMSYKLGGTYIVFVQVEEKFNNPKYHRKRIGLNHLAFCSDSREFVDEMALKIEKRDIKLLYEDRYRNGYDKNIYAIFFEDPDRIKVELVFCDR